MCSVLFLQCVFPLQNFYAGFIKKSKSEGKGDTDHRKEIPKSSLEAIMNLMKLLQEILRCDKNSPKYKELVEKLPEGYQDYSHFLVQKVMVYILLSLIGRRGREGLDSLTKSHFEKMFDEENNYCHWARVKGEKSKNHQ